MCIDKHTVLRNTCPHCRQPLNNSNGFPTIFNDFRSDQEVKSLMVYCSTACGWKGELRSLDNHKQKDCENTLVFCENNCGAINIFQKNLKIHLESKCPNRLHKCPDCGANNQYKNHQLHTKLHCPKRSYSCVHCGENGCFDERTSTHLEVCPKMKIVCKKCLRSILRCQLPTHPKECTFEPVPCKYAEVGCKVRPLRKDLKKHEENYQLHLQVTTETVLELKKMLPKPVAPVTFRVTEFDKRKTDNDVIYSPSFYTSTNGYKMCLRIDANGNGTGKGTHVSVFTCLMAGEYDDYLTWPFTGTITIELLNQLEDDNHLKRTTPFPADADVSERVMKRERGEGYGWPQFTSHTDLALKLANIQYLKDDTLIFRVSAEAPDYKPWLECTNCV
ncbi:TNF receptor-associated factor 4-like [Halichondria panicea]|uniref:TNF receptor-associated factor 4-like n=1 Tax=Halichondria panicea TaxID=6063 RepID=UPI00312BB72A